MDNFQDLWLLVQQLQPSNPLEADALQLQLEGYRDKLTRLLANKVCALEAFSA
jgi:hypothetical protein